MSGAHDGLIMEYIQEHTNSFFVTCDYQMSRRCRKYCSESGVMFLEPIESFGKRGFGCAEKIHNAVQKYFKGF